MNLTIDVTEDDIILGGKGGGKCPITLASNRLLPDQKVWTGKHHLWFDTPKEHMIYTLPPEACQFIEDFDSGKSVKPFSFVAKQYVIVGTFEV